MQRKKKPTGQRRYYHGVVSSWAIKHFNFHKLAALWLARLINTHVRINGSNVAEGFSAFQRRSCVKLLTFWSVVIPFGAPSWRPWLQRHHNERDGVPNDQCPDCLLNCSGTDKKKHQSSVSMAFVRWIHRWPVNSRHKRLGSGKYFHLMSPSWVRVFYIQLNSDQRMWDIHTKYHKSDE